MVKWLKSILAVTIVGFLLWYLAKHWDNLKALLKLSTSELALIYFITSLSSINTGYTNKYLLKALNVKTPFGDMVLLQNAIYLLSYVPMKFSVVFRANYLKRHYGLSYARFGTFFVYLALLLMLTSTTTGLVILVTVYSLAGYKMKVLAAGFLTVLLVSLFFAFVPLPIPAGTSKLSINIRNFLTARHQLTQNKPTLLVCTALLTVNFILSSTRLGIIYNAMGQQVHPAGFLVLGALGYFTMFINLTPGSLGMRELVLAAAATVLGVPLEVGVLAAMIDRAIALSYSFVIGGLCTISLWRKSPIDFKEAKT
jgi:uncharacterized membrane protein YbhN (UPF0104 family)